MKKEILSTSAKNITGFLKRNTFDCYEKISLPY